MSWCNRKKQSCHLLNFKKTNSLTFHLDSYKLWILWGLSVTCQPLLPCWQKGETLTICPQPQQQHTKLSGSIRENEKTLLQGRDSLCVSVFHVSVWGSFGKGICANHANLYRYVRMCASLWVCACMSMSMYEHVQIVTLKGRKGRKTRMYNNNTGVPWAVCKYGYNGNALCNYGWLHAFFTHWEDWERGGD